MIRSIGIVLVIWGLIVQPLMAAMPETLTDDTAPYSMAVDADGMANANGHHAAQDTGQSSKAPCHEKETDNASSESCDNCDSDCMGGICGTACVISGAAAIQKSVNNFNLDSSITISSFSGARAYGLPSRIFHPPKHA